MRGASPEPDTDTDTPRDARAAPGTARPHRRVRHVGVSLPGRRPGRHPYLSVEVVQPDIRVATPYGPSPVVPPLPVDRPPHGPSTDYLYVWMHGLDPENRSEAPGTGARASERVFDVLHRAGVRRVIVDNSTGGVAEDLRPWDLAVVGDVLDLSGVVPRPVAPGAHPVPRAALPPARPATWREPRSAACRAWRPWPGPGDAPRVKSRRALRPHAGPLVRDADRGPPLPAARARSGGQDRRSRVPPGPHVRHVPRDHLDRRQPGGGARGVRARRPPGDLPSLRARAMARLVIEALAEAASEDGTAKCHCGDDRTGSLLREFAPHARYGGDRRHG